MKHKASLVVTTINDGSFLDRYAERIRQENVAEKVEMFVIPDKKTPVELYRRVEQIRDKGIHVRCPNLNDQETFLKKLRLENIIPFNSDNRRNIGFLMAIENESDYLISIDDDNLCSETESFFAEHSIVCEGPVALSSVRTSNGWFNICSLMNVEPLEIYARGFPYYARCKKTETEIIAETGCVHINAGLWLRHPDVDAITWLAAKPISRSAKSMSVLLASDTWSPINTQNTSLKREAIPAYYFARMGHSVAGMNIDRYGDIFSGYFCQACARHLGYRVRVGTPVTDHVRNSHNYLKDLTNELACICLLEDILPWLCELRLEGANYIAAYLSLADALDEFVEKQLGFMWVESSRAYFHALTYAMRRWIAAIRMIEGTGNGQH